MSYKLGSLFDGSGGFPLAGALCGIEPTWAAEVEPYPIAVTRSRFPHMTHLGDISKVNGAGIEPVDIITFGSPCQDLSVAGKRAGLKHEANGDEETTRSGLFMEAVRIIKEMREATNGEYPSFALWENVPGAFSSNSGEDFRTVLEELIRIVEPGAVMPEVPKAGWAYADSYAGSGWSLAYRVFDAQYWGVPQRRRRIHLVVDFRGEHAREILFEREGVRGYFTQGRTPWQAITADASDGTGADDRAGEAAGAGDGGLDAVAYTSDPNPSKNQGGIAIVEPALILDDQGGRQYLFENHSQDTRYKGPLDVAPIVSATYGMGGNNQPFVVAPFCKAGRARSADDATTWKPGVVANTLNTFDLGEARANELVVYSMKSIARNGKVLTEQANPICASDYKDPDIVAYPALYCTQGNGIIEQRVAGVDCRNGNESIELYPTLQAKPNGGQSLNFSGAVRQHYIVRRLTPTECARLQGFADRWGDIDQKDSLTEAEYQFWLEVRNTHARINGRAEKDYSPAQMLTWYNKLQTDSAEYKMWGNGIALPPALYCLQGMAEALEKAAADDWMN